MKRQKLRVVVDTNVIISGLLFPTSKPYQIIELWRRDSYTLLLSNLLLLEINDVLQRKKIQKYLKKDTFFPVMQTLLIKQAEFIKITEALPIKVRDIKDEMIITTALSGKADYIITGDEDLLILDKHPKLEKLQIITVKEFLMIIKAKR